MSARVLCCKNMGGGVRERQTNGGNLGLIDTTDSEDIETPKENLSAYFKKRTCLLTKR